MVSSLAGRSKVMMNKRETCIRITLTYIIITTKITMATSAREYDIVLFGATGFTGQYTAEHIVQFFSSDLKWAIAGRSESKLKGVAESLRKLNPDRKAPGK